MRLNYVHVMSRFKDLDLFNAAARLLLVIINKCDFNKEDNFARMTPNKLRIISRKEMSSSEIFHWKCLPKMKIRNDSHLFDSSRLDI